MSASARAALAATATALLASEQPTPRAAALRRSLAGTPRAALSLADLRNAPAWLAWPPEARRRLGQRAALATIAPALAASIDGGWLKQLAATAGDDAVDWAMGLAPEGSAVPFAATALDGLAAAMLRGAVPAVLRDFAADAGFGVPSPVGAVAALERALECEDDTPTTGRHPREGGDPWSRQSSHGLPPSALSSVTMGPRLREDDGKGPHQPLPVPQ